MFWYRSSIWRSIAAHPTTPHVNDFAIFARTRANIPKFTTYVTLRALGPKGSLRFAVVGGGSTGVEVAANLRQLLDVLLPQYPSLSGPGRVRPFTASGRRRAAPHGPAAASHSSRPFGAEQIEVNTDARVAPVDDAGVDLKDGSRIDAGSVVWAAGVKSSSIVSRINAAPVDDKGRLKVDENLRLLGQDGVYALGDIAPVTSAGKAGAADRSGHHPRGCGSGRQPGRRADGRPATSVRLSSLGDARRSGDSVRGQPGAQPQALWRHRTGAVASRFTTTMSAIAVTGWV